MVRHPSNADLQVTNEQIRHGTATQSGNREPKFHQLRHSPNQPMKNIDRLRDRENFSELHGYRANKTNFTQAD